MSIDNFDVSIPVASRKGKQSPPYFHVNNNALVDWANADHDSTGHHEVIIFTPQADQAGTSDQGKLYGKDVDGKIELFYTDDDGNDLQLTNAGIVNADIPAGTKMWFYENSAPTNWTYYGGTADKVLATKGGSQAYNTSGGLTAGTWTQPYHTLSSTEMPIHNHTIQGTGGGLVAYTDALCYGVVGGYTGPGAKYNTTGHGETAIGYAGSGDGHNHGTTYRPAAAVGIICTRNDDNDAGAGNGEEY